MYKSVIVLLSIIAASLAAPSPNPAPAPAPSAKADPSHTAIYSPGSYSYQSQYVEHSPAVLKTIVSHPTIVAAPLIRAYEAPATIVKYEHAPILKSYDYPVVHTYHHAPLAPAVYPAALHAPVLLAAH